MSRTERLAPSKRCRATLRVGPNAGAPASWLLRWTGYASAWPTPRACCCGACTQARRSVVGELPPHWARLPVPTSRRRAGRPAGPTLSGNMRPGPRAGSSPSEWSAAGGVSRPRQAKQQLLTHPLLPASPAPCLRGTVRHTRVGCTGGATRTSTWTTRAAWFPALQCPSLRPPRRRRLRRRATRQILR